MEDSLKKATTFMEDSLKKTPPSESGQPLKKIIKPSPLVTRGLSDFKSDMQSPVDVKSLKMSPTNNRNLGTPSPNNLKFENRFYNDALLIISILIEMFMALIEELKLPSSIN